jgi:hypothetical protein
MRRLIFATPLLFAASSCSSKSTSSAPAVDPFGEGPAASPANLAPACTGALAPDGAALAFVDHSAAWEIDKSHLYVVGNHLEAIDLDADGYPDLLVHSGAQARSDPSQPPNKQLTRVLMNRPKAGGGRHFVDATVASNYGAVRDGTAPANGLLRQEHLSIAADVDGDGDVDLFSGTYTDPTADRTKVPDTGDRDEVLLNDGKGHFSLAPKSAPQTVSATLQPTTSAAFTDVDRDGIVDVWVGAWYKAYGSSPAGVQARLFKGKGDGTFVDATPGSGLETQSAGFVQGLNHRPLYGVTACDLDGDGLPELLGSAYGRQWNLLYQNLGAASGAPTFAEIGRPSGFAGDDDLNYQDNQFYECYCQATGSCTPQSTPQISPCDASSWDPGSDPKPWRLNGNTFSTVCADLNGDGKNDLYSAEIKHWHIGESADGSELLANDGPRADGSAPIHFTRPGRPATGLDWKHVGSDWNEGGIMVAAADLDLDGLEDLVVGASDYPNNWSLVYRQKHDAPGTFEEVGEAIGLHHACTVGLAIADFDRDGDLDVVVGSSLARDCAALYPDGNQVFFFENTLNDGAKKRGFLQVELDGKKGASNRTGIGARVRVIPAGAGGRMISKELSGGYGHFGMQNDTVLTFGLGGACKVDEIEVRWPDAPGTVERYTGVGGGQRVKLTQGAGIAASPVAGP